MSKPGQNLVKVNLSYLELEDGEPVEREEERYMYFTMRSVSDMYKRMGIDEQKAREYAEEAKEADDEDEAAKQFEMMAREEVQTSEVEAGILLIWAALQWDARQRGEELTPDDVGDLIDADNVERILIQARRAMYLFREGTLPSYEEFREMLNEENEEEDEAREEIREKEAGKSLQPSSEPGTSPR